MNEDPKEMLLTDALKVAIDSQKKIYFFERLAIIETITIIGLLVILFWR